MSSTSVSPATRIVWTEEAKRLCAPRAASDVRMKRVKNAWQRLLDMTLRTRVAKEPAFALDTPENATLENLVGALNTSTGVPDAAEMLDVIARVKGAPLAVEVAWKALESRAWSYASALRQVMLLASDEDRASAREKARELMARGNASHAQILLVAYTFFENEDWADQAFRATQGVTNGLPAQQLLAILRAPDAVRDVLARRETFSQLFDVVAQLGDAALPVLIENFKAPKDVWDLGHTAEALALFESDEVGRLLLSEVGKKQVRKPAAAFFNRFPEVAQRVLPEVASGKTNVAKLARDFLEQANRVTGATAPASEEASLAELPPLLAAAPFVGKPPDRPKRQVVPNVAIEAPKARVRFTSLAQREARASALERWRSRWPEMSAEEADAILEASVRQGNLRWMELSEEACFRSRTLPAEHELRVFNEGVRVSGYDQTPAQFVALFGDRAIPGVIRNVESARNLYELRDAISEIESAELASALTKHAAADPAHVFEYMIAHPEAAVLGLVPVAVGELGDARDSAERALRELAARGHRLHIEEVATSAGPDTARAVAEVLDQDRGTFDFAKTLRLGETYRPAALTRPVLRASGKALPLAALENVCTALALSSPWQAHPVVRAAREACEERSLAELSWDLAMAWYNGGRRERDRWMVESIIHLANDEVTRRTTPAIKDDAIVEVLGWIPTHAAATEVLTILARAEGQTRPLYTTRVVEAALHRIARLRGTSVEELEDRVVDTLGLDRAGEVRLDFGARTVRVRIDARLEPTLLDEDGSPLKAFPAARKNDDRAKVAAARARYAELTEDFAAVAARRFRALDQAMRTGRVWTKDTFVAVWAEHPLQRHIAAGVIWEAEQDGSKQTFRVAEDSSLADEHDAVFVLRDGALVRVAAFASMSPETVARWTERLHEYRIVSHVPQLAPPAPSG